MHKATVEKIDVSKLSKYLIFPSKEVDKITQQIRESSQGQASWPQSATNWHNCIVYAPRFQIAFNQCASQLQPKRANFSKQQHESNCRILMQLRICGKITF